MSGVLFVDENSYYQTFNWENYEGELEQEIYEGELEISENFTYIYYFEFEDDGEQYLGKNYWVKE